MLIIRWQAQVVPIIDQIRHMFISEDLSPNEEIQEVNSKTESHRHPFDEIRMIAEGEMLINISGNQVLLRAGDKIIIPSNTKHDILIHGSTPCISVYAFRIS